MELSGAGGLNWQKDQRNVKHIKGYNRHRISRNRPIKVFNVSQFPRMLQNLEKAWNFLKLTETSILCPRTELGRVRSVGRAQSVRLYKIG
jgi:hypothetical protein